MKNIFFLIGICITLLSCGDSRSPTEHIANAKASINNQQYSAAIIELKTVIKKEPELAEARYLLGKSYFLTGMLQPAKKELNRALKTGFDFESILPLLVRTNALLSNDINIDEYKNYPLSNNLIAELRTIIGFDLITKGKYIYAIEQLKQVLALGVEDNFYFKLSKAWIANIDGQKVNSIALSESLLANDSEFKDALLLNAMLQTLDKDYDKAIEYYEVYLEQSIFTYYVKLNYLSVLIANNNLTKAEEYTDEQLSRTDRDPFFYEYKAELRFRATDFPKAAENAAIALAIIPNSFKANFIAGVSHYKSGNIEQAYRHLAKIEESIPSQHMAYQILMSLRFQLGYNTEAITKIDALTNFTEDDFNLLSSASWGLLENDNKSKAAEYINKLENINTHNPKHLVQKGLLKLSINDQDGMKDLFDVIKVDPSYHQARVAILYTHLKNKDFDLALAVANEWIEKYPDTEGGYISKGLVYKSSNKEKLAKQFLQKAMAINSKSIGANFLLSSYDLQEQKFQDAYDKSALILEQNHQHKGAIKNVVVASEFLESSQEAVALLKKLIEKNGSSYYHVELSLALAQVFERRGDLTKALDTLKELKPLATNSKGFLYLYGIYNLKDNNLPLAEQSFTELIAKDKYNLQAFTGLFIALENQKKYQKTLTSIYQAKEHFSDNENLNVYEAKILMHLGEYSKSLIIIDNINPENVNTTLLNQISAQLFVKTKNYKRATQLGKELYDAQPNNGNAYFYGQALQGNGQAQLALDVINLHITTLPTDDKINSLRAELQLELAPEQAIAYYQEQVNSNPQNYIALNNLAWAAIKANNFDLGIESAEKAHAIAPQVAQVNDTLAVAYMRVNKNKEAEELLKNALDLEPENEEFSLHYAEVFYNLEQFTKSKAILDQLESSPDKTTLLNKLKQD